MTLFKIVKRKSEVRLDYELRPNHREEFLKHYQRVVEEISRKTGHVFVVTQGSFQLVAYPFLNLDVIIDHQAYSMRWTIENDNERAVFIRGLKELEMQLRGLHILDGDAIDVDRMLKALIRDRNEQPKLQKTPDGGLALATGTQTYRITIEEEPITEFDIGDEFKQAIAQEVADLQRACDDQIESERAENVKAMDKIKAESKELYQISYQDVLDGWVTFLEGPSIMLAKPFVYQPKYYLTHGNTHRIKDAVRAKYSITGYIIYSKQHGVVYVRSGPKGMATPHTSSSDGSLCLGSLDRKPGLDLVKAKEFLVRVADMMLSINRDSVTNGHWAGLDISDRDKFIDKYCEGADGSEAGEIIDPLAIGVVL